MLNLRLIIACSLFLLANTSLQAQCPISVNAGEDVYLCSPPTPTELNGDISGDYMNFNWTPTTGMIGGNTLSPTVTVNTTTNYVLSASAADLSNNLVSNGDFEGGAGGFDSDYIFSPGNLVPEGLYDVLANPQDDHMDFAPCNDHTSGSGNMMVVNGAGTPNQNVWCQTIPVDPNAQYVLSAWVTSVVSGSPALLQFSINGVTLGPIFNAPGGTCGWQNYFQTWNSGANTSATICIVNQNTILGGNDFALDDIVFSPLCTVRDTVTVHVINVNAVAAPNLSFIPCEGAEIQLSGNGSSIGPNISYEWMTDNGTIVSGGNTLTPTVSSTGEYTLSVSYSANGEVYCTKTATVTVVPSPNPLTAWVNPPQPLGCGAPTTNLIGNSSQAGVSTYEWTTADGNIVSGADLKNCVVNQVGTYTLLVTNTITGCTASADVTVSLTNNVPAANAVVNGLVTCAHDTIPLLGTGSSTGANIAYSWTTINGQISGPKDSLNTSVSAGGLYILHVTNTSNNCTSNDTVVVSANLTLPSVMGTLPPQLSCDPNQDTISLFIFVGPPPFVLINWTTANGLIVSGQYTPAPQASQPGTYTVSVFDPANGCYNYDTSQVLANFTVPLADILPADTLTCLSPNIQLQGSGSTVGANFSIEWTPSNGGNIVSGGNTLNPTVNSAGDYLLILRDSVSQCADTAMVSVLADTSVVVAIANAPDTLNCSINAVNLNANGSSAAGNLSYAWTTTNGNILSGANTPNPVVNAPGDYTLLLTNNTNGCAATDLATVLLDNAPPQVSISTPDTLTCAVSTQILQALNATLNGNFVYAWTASNGGNIVSGDSSLTPTINQPGLYTLTSTNLANGCSSTTSVTVALEAGFPIVNALANGPLTCLVDSQVLNSTGSSVGPNFNYNWTTLDGNISLGANTASPTVTAPGLYTLQITNSNNGCAVSATVLVLQDTLAPANAILTPSDTLNCQSTQLELIGDGTGNGQWSTTDGNILFTSGYSAQIDAPGTYVFTTTNPNNGCSAVASLPIFEDVQTPGLSIAPPAILNCFQSTGILAATATGQNLQYNWQTANGNITNGMNTANPVVDAAGNYSLTVTNGTNGCTASANINVVQDTVAPNIQIAPPPVLTCDLPSITVNATNLSLPGNFSYLWTASGGANITSGANSLSPTIDAAGVATFACFNVVNGCETQISVTISEDINFPTANAGANDTLACLSNTLTINGSGAGATTLEYNWTATSGGNILSGANSPTPLINQAGTYTLVVENPVNGCTASDTVEIFKDANAPLVNAGTAATLTCNQTQTTLNGTASNGTILTYNWTASSGGNILTGENTLNPLVDNPGIYTLEVTNSTNGCSATSSVTVPENIIPPTVDAGIADNLTCAVTSLSLAGNSTGGAASYSWSTVNGNILSGGNTLNPTITQAGTYVLSATLASNGCSANDLVTVGMDTLAPGFTLEPPLLLTCDQLTTALIGMVQQPAGGNYSAQWTTIGGHFASTQNTLNTSADAPGTYILTIQSTLNGCEAQQQIIVNQDTIAPIAFAAPGNELTCTVQTLNLNGTGSSAGNIFTYHWTASAGGTILNGVNTLTPTVGSTGTYTLLVNNATTGCTSTATTAVISNITPPTVSIAPPALLTCLQNQVTLDGSGSSQGPNFSASWSTLNGNIVSGQNTFVATANQGGLYSLTVLNTENGCTETAQLQVQANTATPGALILPTTPLHCNQQQITLLGSSPTLGSLNYAWTAASGGNLVNGSNTPTPLIDQAGLYTLSITNPANGCSSETSITITAIPDPAFVPELNQPNCKLTTGAVYFGTLSGGLPPFQYSLDGGQTFSDEDLYEALEPGDYPLVLTDANGCIAAESVTIDAPFLPSLALSDILKIEQGDSILLSPLTNIPPNQIAFWSWSPANGLSCTDCPTPWAKPMRGQYYTVKVEDLDGCEAEARVLIQVIKNRHIYPPTVFTPNEDGENDRFTLYTKGVREIRRLAIFDRWGEEVFLRNNFQPNDDSLGWDGTFRGSPMTPAVFVWAAEVEFTDGEVEVIYGDVTVVR